MSAILVPPALEPGDCIAVVAPSSPVPEGELWPSLAWLRGRYRLRMSARVLARRGFLAGSDADRAHELRRALEDPEVKAVVAVRGGYGSLRILESIDLHRLVDAPRWLVGFSDITALHAATWALGVASIHGPHVATLRGASPSVRASFLAALERPLASRQWSELRVMHAGVAEGPLVGGNLTLLFSMAASGLLVVPEGAILALEDVTERPYRVDRMLTALALGGHLARVSGIVFGGFDQCDAGADGVDVLEVLAERTRALGVPVLCGAPFGHGHRNEAFVLGLPARMQGNRVFLAAPNEATSEGTL